MNIFLSLILGIVTTLTGYGFYTDTTPREMVDALGSTMTGSAWFLNASQQIQAGAATWGLRIPSLSSSGDCLTTDASGVVSTSACGSGSGGSNWTILLGGLRTSTSTDFAQANNFIATSTTVKSTFPLASTTALTTTRGYVTQLANLTSNGFVKTGSSNGTLSIDTSTYLTTVDISANTNLTGGLGLTLTGDDMACDTASGSVFGCLSSTDWNTFNGKESVLTFSNGLTRTTNNIAPTSGYNIPLTASTTNWNGFYNTPSTRITAGTNLSWAGNTLNASGAATGTTLICASGCPYSNIQTAIDAGVKNIQLKEETYAGPISIKFTDTKITGAGATSTIITCDATVNANCVSVATSTRLTRIILRDFAIDNTSVSPVGTGLDTSDTSKVYTQNIRVTDFNIAHLNQDTTNSTFYSKFENMDYYASSTCFKTGGTKSNDNVIDTARCIVTAPTGIGYWFIDSEGWLLSNINAEPGSLIGTGLYIDATSVGISVINPWFEGNATGTEIRAGALNTSIKGGRITAGTVGVSDGGTNTFLDSTLISANTTNHSCPTTCLGTYINTSSSYATPHILVGTTTQNTSFTRLGLNISTSDATANMLVLNNAGAFATAPAGLQFTHSSGGFPDGTARIYANPGSGYVDPSLTFSVADSSQILRDRLTINALGNVGIGTTTPSSLLTVAGDTNITGNLSVLDRVTFDDTDFNTKIGYQAGKNIVSGAQFNTFSGYQAGFSSSTAASTTADNNSAFGYQALYSNTTGSENTGNGREALYSNTTGYNNTANGVLALYANTTGTDNTANGAYALRLNTTGNYNTALGYSAGRYYGSGTSFNQTSNSSTYLGYSTRAGANGSTNEIVIGHSAIGSGSNSVTLGSTTITNTILRGNVSVGTNATSTTSFFSALGTFTNMVVNTLATFLNVVVTGLLDVGAGVLEIPNGTGPTVDSIGELALDSTSNQLVLYGTEKKVIGNGNIYPAFTYATSTAWTGTTTIPLGTAFIAETWNAVQCFTDVGTLSTRFGDGTNWTNVNNSSTTVGTTVFTANNTFTAGEKRYVEVGTPASSPTKISCTVSKSITAD